MPEIENPRPSSPKEVVPLEVAQKLQQENSAMRRELIKMQVKKPKPWYKKWCRIGGLIAVAGPIVNYLLGGPVDQWIIMLVVGAIIAWIGTENYKDQKIAVAKVLSDTQIDIERLKAATAPAFRDALERIRASKTAQPPGK